MVISLMVVITSTLYDLHHIFIMYMSIVHFKYIQFLVVNYTTTKMKKKRNILKQTDKRRPQ